MSFFILRSDEQNRSQALTCLKDKLDEYTMLILTSSFPFFSFNKLLTVLRFAGLVHCRFVFRITSVPNLLLLVQRLPNTVLVLNFVNDEFLPASELVACLLGREN